MNIKKILTPLLIILLLFSIVVMGAPNYGNVGPTTEFGFDIKIEDEIVCEGSTADEFETTFTITDPTANRTYTFPDSDQTYDLSLYYLKTEMDSFSELQTIIADKTLVNTTDKLNVFAATSSAEFAGVISDETGSGLLVYGTSPNITTPTGIVRGDVGLGNVENLKVKLDATEAPTVNNDVDEGYAVGSRWIDVTNDKEYICLNNTDGAAVWTETTGAGGGAGTYLELTDTPAAYDNGKYAKSTVDGVVWDTPAGAGTVTTSGTPVQYDYARFTSATTIEGREYSEIKTDLAYQLSDMSDVGITTPTDKYALMADGDSWESRALVEADISDLGTYLEDITGESIGDLDDVDLTDIADTKVLKYNNATSKWECEDAAGGYTNLTSFVEQTAWRLFYSNTDGDVTELALGTDGQVLTSGGASVAPSFEDAGGAGETNTASNIGDNVEIFKQKTDEDLEFRTLKADSDKIKVTITDPPEKKAYQDTIGALYSTLDSPSKHVGQYWITASAYWVGVIKVRMYRAGSPGNVTLNLYACDGVNKPEGDSLSSVIINGNVITSSSSGGGELVTFDIEDVPLDNATSYAWVINAPALNASNKLFFCRESTPLANSGFIYTSNSGESWTVGEQDLIFQVWASSAPYDYVMIDVVESEIRLDDLKATEDNTDNNASTTAHGLMPKLPFSGDLLSTTTVAFNADADTTIYTVPTGKRCVLSHAIVVAAGDAGATTTLSIGANGAETDFIPANTLSNLDAEYDSVILQPIPNTTPLKIKSYAAATVIEAQVASQSGAAGNTVYLFGITY